MTQEFIVMDDGTGRVNGVPKKVTRRQALQALFARRGITEEMIEAAIRTAMETAEEAKADSLELGLALIEFRASLEFERARPLVIAMGPLLGLTPIDLDHLFVVAETL